VPGIIERGAHEVVHRRIDDDERVGHSGLYADHTRQENASVGDNQPSWLEHQPGVPIASHSFDHCAIIGGARRRRLIRVVRHAEPATEVGDFDIMAGGAKLRDQSADAGKGALERVEACPIAPGPRLAVRAPPFPPPARLKFPKTLAPEPRSRLLLLPGPGAP